MRFPRNAKIFRGQLDPAPVAGVFFLLLIFILLSSLLYTPGVLIELGRAAVPSRPDQTITVTAKNEILFEGKNFKAGELEQLRVAIKNATNPEALFVKPESGASGRLVSQVRELIRVTPPLLDDLPGTDNPTVVVAVNLRGQFFWENRMVQEAELRGQLEKRLRDATGTAKDLTLMVLADKAVENETLVRLFALARSVGIKQVEIGTRPSVFSGAPMK